MLQFLTHILSVSAILTIFLCLWAEGSRAGAFVFYFMISVFIVRGIILIRRMIDINLLRGGIGDIYSHALKSRSSSLMDFYYKVATALFFVAFILRFFC